MKITFALLNGEERDGLHRISECELKPKCRGASGARVHVHHPRENEGRSLAVGCGTQRFAHMHALR